MYIPPIQDGLLSDVVNRVNDLIPIFPGPIDDAIRRVVDTAVQVVDPQLPTPYVPEDQPILPPETTPDQEKDIVDVLNTAINGIGAVLRFRFLIPAQYERPLEILAKALVWVRDRLD